MGISIADLPEGLQQQVAKKLLEQAAPAALPASKYKNRRTKYKSVQGFTVLADSKLEANLFAVLDRGMVDGLVKWWIPHPRFPLPGKVVYEADALSVDIKYGVMIYDAKGFMTQTSKNKIKQVEELYGVTIEIVRK